MTEPEPYRRGLTFGLTVAEILILLLFLLLLALSAFNVENEEKNEQFKTELEVVKKERDEARKPFPEDIQELKRENKSLKKDLKAAQLYSSKGIDPPCWYKVTERRGKRHEQPYFLFNIAVRDADLLVRLLEAPPGRAIDESGRSAPTSYAEEYAKLPLTLDETRDIPISIEGLKEIAEPILMMGKDEQIRDYSCVFHVKVWDLTSETAKKRWQQAEDAIGKWFYTYRVRDDPWESDDATT